MKYVFYMTFVTLGTVFGMYFHEPSVIEIKPSEDIDQMEFGFSLAYQNSGKLAVGSPRADLNGRVYVCNMDDIKKNNSVCQKMDIDVEKLTQYSTREHNPKQYYYLGASVVATQDYFVTCAPLWMSSYKKINPEKFKNVNTSAYGTCFIYNGTAYQYNGLYEQHVQKSIKNRQAFSGGIGWTSLVDKNNGLILIAKMFSRGDISYVSQSAPLSPARSIVQDKLRYFSMHISPNRNVGFALASGIFSISGVKETIYALSMENNDMTYTVGFLRYRKKSNSLALLKVEIVHETINAMFGAAIVCEDLDEDGYSELLVGAPAQGDDDDGYEVGALYVFTGGELNTIVDGDRMRSIIGTKPGSRFGSAIACTDIDGDHLPEVIVSAPYEDSGKGAIYIISGSELNQMLLKEEVSKTIILSQLASTQRIQSKTFKSFGASLQVIKDVNENGCDELAVGCPESSRVSFYRSIPSVRMAVSMQLVGEQVVRIKDKNFTVRLEVDITYPEKLKTVIGKIKLLSSIIGDGVQIADGQATQFIDLSLKKSTYTIDVDVNIEGNEPGSYKFSTVIESESDSIFDSKDFNPSWVILNPNILRPSLEINRRCSGESCLPKLNMTLEWSGSTEYTLGSTKSEVVTVRFKNEGNSSYAQTCAFMTVKGARVAESDCINTDAFYKCLLPVPMRRDEEYPMKIKLDMTKSNSKDRELAVDVTFFKSGCSLKNDFSKLNLTVPYKLETDVITVKGLSHDRVITDREVMDTTTNVVEDAHEYAIVNHGEVLWKGISAIVKWKKYPFIETYKVSLTSTISNCKKQDKKDEVMFICIFNFEPHASIKVISTMEISETGLEENLVDNYVNASSTFELFLTANETKGLSLTTFIEYRKVLSLQQNKLLIILIAIIVAVIIIALVAFILYKIGFFNRNTKKQLIEEKKEHEIRKSMRRPNPDRDQSTSGGQTNSIEVMDAPLNPQADRSYTADKDNLISTSKAEVH